MAVDSRDTVPCVLPDREADLLGIQTCEGTVACVLPGNEVDLLGIQTCGGTPAETSTTKARAITTETETEGVSRGAGGRARAGRKRGLGRTKGSNNKGAGMIDKGEVVERREEKHFAAEEGLKLSKAWVH